MKKIAIHSRPFEPEHIPYIHEILGEICKRDRHIVVSEAFEREQQAWGLKKSYDVFTTPDQIADADLMLSVGGDGTFLESVLLTERHHVPILGINTGRLGFLATTALHQIRSHLDAYFNGYYTVESRTLLQLHANIPVFDGPNIALNEFAILKRDTASMIVVHTYINGEFLNSYWADGLIVATPTGSTGYALSTGGPVVVPNSGNFVIAPVSPHNLNVRPLIIPDSSVIAFEIEGRSKNFLAVLDSRSAKVDANIQLAVSKADFCAHYIQFNNESFLKTLRQKLNWGMDIRNYPKDY
ncbi:MAG: NAD kinase [Bernardetiaceae bacterium]